MQSTGANPFGAGSGINSSFRPSVNVSERQGRFGVKHHNVLPPSLVPPPPPPPAEEEIPTEGYAAKRRSEEERTRNDEQAVLDKLAAPRVFIPYEVPRGKRTREVQSQFLLESYHGQDLPSLFAERGFDFSNPVRRVPRVGSSPMS